MTRCPHCHSPNPENKAYCADCGGALAVVRQPLFHASDWFQGAAALAALRSAFFFSVIFVLAAGEFLELQANRQEGKLACLFILFGVALAAFGAKRAGLRLGAWLGLGVLGGLMAYSLDFFYTYQHWLYKAVWWTVTLLAPSGDNRAAAAAYGILQMLRFFGLAAGLVLVQATGRRASLRLKAALFFLLAETLIFHVRGAFLRFSLTFDFAEELVLYFSALFLLYYGLDRLDGNTPK
jgi:hypothetical protein